MYKSPIKTNVTCESTTLARKYDDTILTEIIHKVDIDVDKEELLKALRYDRDQYVKGFNDGVESVKSKPVKDKWLPVTEQMPEEEQPVLVVRKFLGVKGQVPPSVYVEIAERIGDDWCADSDEYKIARSRHTNPTHWMPLPEPPEEETC